VPDLTLDEPRLLACLASERLRAWRDWPFRSYRHWPVPLLLKPVPGQLRSRASMPASKSDLASRPATRIGTGSWPSR